jgi:hypothetical protein
VQKSHQQSDGVDVSKAIARPSSMKVHQLKSKFKPKPKPISADNADYIEETERNNA